MRTARTLPFLLLALLAFVPAAFADEDPKEVVEDLLSGEPRRVAAAEKEIQVGSAEFLRGVIRLLRERVADAAIEFVPAPTAPTPRPVPPEFFPVPDPSGHPVEPPELPAPPAADAKLVTIETRLVDAEVGKARELGLVDARGQVSAKPLSPEEVEALSSAIRSSKALRVTSAPRITVYDRQRANVSVLDQVSFIQDYDVETAKDGTRVVDPIVGTIAEGLTIEMTPSTTADGAEVLVDLEVTLSELKRPIEEFRTTLAGQQVTIQLPELRIARNRSRVATAVGRTMLVHGFPRGEGRLTLVLLEIVDVIAGSDVELGPPGFRPPEEPEEPPPGPPPGPPPSPPVPK